MTHIISISNHKGGVGKTTSTQNIGVGLSKSGKKVLLVDLDPQANLSDAFGYDQVEISIYDALLGKQDLPIIELTGNLHLVPSNIDLSVAEPELTAKTGREYKLKEILEEIKDNYDYILIDCPPSLGLLTVNAFTASTEIYIPIDGEYFALKGLDKLIMVINEVKKVINPNIEITGAFVTRFDKRLIINRTTEELLKEYFPNRVFKTQIRKNVSLVEAPANNQSIYTYSPESTGAEDYKALVEEIIATHEPAIHAYE